MDNFKFIYKILRALEQAMDLSDFNEECISHQVLGISKERWTAYLEMLSDSGYVKGVIIKNYAGGDKLVDVSGMKITLKGLEYLSENNIMQKFYSVTKGVVDLIPGIGTLVNK